MSKRSSSMIFNLPDQPVKDRGPETGQHGTDASTYPMDLKHIRDVMIRGPGKKPSFQGGKTQIHHEGRQGNIAFALMNPSKPNTNPTLLVSLAGAEWVGDSKELESSIYALGVLDKNLRLGDALNGGSALTDVHGQGLLSTPINNGIYDFYTGDVVVARAPTFKTGKCGDVDTIHKKKEFGYSESYKEGQIPLITVPLRVALQEFELEWESTKQVLFDDMLKIYNIHSDGDFGEPEPKKDRVYNIIIGLASINHSRFDRFRLAKYSLKEFSKNYPLGTFDKNIKTLELVVEAKKLALKTAEDRIRPRDMEIGQEISPENRAILVALQKEITDAKAKVVEQENLKKKKSEELKGGQMDDAAFIEKLPELVRMILAPFSTLEQVIICELILNVVDLVKAFASTPEQGEVRMTKEEKAEVAKGREDLVKLIIRVKNSIDNYYRSIKPPERYQLTSWGHLILGTIVNIKDTPSSRYGPGQHLPINLHPHMK